MTNTYHQWAECYWQNNKPVGEYPWSPWRGRPHGSWDWRSTLWTGPGRCCSSSDCCVAAQTNTGYGGGLGQECGTKQSCYSSSISLQEAWGVLCKDNLDGLVKERRNSSALAMELRLSWTNPSICVLSQKLPCCLQYHVNTLAPGRCASNFKSIIFKILHNSSWTNWYENVLRWIPQNTFDDK